MENSIVNTNKDSQEREDPSQCLAEEIESLENDNLSKRLVILSIKKPQTSENCIQESLLRSICGLENKIPKQISSFDEIYLRRCLELVQLSAFSDSLSTRDFSTISTFDLASFGIECPLLAEAGDVIITTDGDPILGTITRSQSMINILKSPLFQKFGAIDSDANLVSSLIDAGESVSSDFTSSSGGLCINSPQKLQKDMVVLGDLKYTSEPVHKRVFSVSSTTSTCSDQSSTSTFGAVSHGILQSTWYDGIPHFVFSLDDQREIYMANLLKVESTDDKILDYMYMFRSRTGGKKENEVYEKESNLVGKMKVSTSFTLCPNNTEVMETQFVLFGGSDWDTCVGELQTSSYTLGRNKGLSKKMGGVFRASHLSRQRTSSKFAGTSAILENSSWEPHQDSLNPLGGGVFQENYLPPNVELAAIIVKDHIHEVHEEPRIGGWGFNFLKKVESRKMSETDSTPFECCQRNSSDCSTSIDILIPAGFHGGPRTRNGGPSSLIKRWSSGGQCDCGGWDIGCPLTVLNTKMRKEGSPEADAPEDSKTFDIFVHGSKQGAPIMKMNVHNGLYYIHFQSPLSPLQSFSIAAAIIHTRSPALRPKVYRS
ncbi:hypothetical protein LguiA_001423 [Lonicera macranthoides]